MNVRKHASKSPWRENKKKLPRCPLLQREQKPKATLAGSERGSGDLPPSQRRPPGPRRTRNFTAAPRAMTRAARAAPPGRG